MDTAPPAWVRCAGCAVTLYHPRLERELGVCPECGHHHRIDARTRIAQLTDPGSWVPAAGTPTSTDPLSFTDRQSYPQRLARARHATGSDEAIVYGRALVGGHDVVLAIMEFGFLGGSMGSAVGEAVARAAEESARTRAPLVLVCASGGARMQEGALSLMQMARTASAMRALQRAGVLSVCVLTNPTYGGVTASFATLADVLVGERGAMIGFAGPRVIENATRERLPKGFQTAEFLFDAGLLDRVEPRRGLRPLLTRLLMAVGGPVDSSGTVVPANPLEAALHRETRPELSAAATLRLARDVARPTTLDLISLLCDEFVELHGDRHGQDDPAVVGGPAILEGRPVMLIGHQKGHDTAELVARSFGMPQPQGYRKAARLVRLADRLRLPVLTFVDTQGAAPGVNAERHGQAWAIADCLTAMADLRSPSVAVITGEGGSGGALALALSNRVLMLEYACYSVISPESCSTILHGDPSRATEMAEALQITAPELHRLGVADAVVDEPPGGTQVDPLAGALAVGHAVRCAFAELADLAAGDPEHPRRHRYLRFRDLGVIADD